MDKFKRNPFLLRIIALMERGLVSGDLTPTKHYGVTSDGRVVIFDYGLSTETHKRFYR